MKYHAPYHKQVAKLASKDCRILPAVRLTCSHELYIVDKEVIRLK